MDNLNCSRCGCQIPPDALESGESTLVEGQLYCDPCSDVLFGLLDPSEAPPPLQEDWSAHNETQAPLVESDEDFDTSSVEEISFGQSTLAEADLLDTSSETVPVDVDNFEDLDESSFESLESIDVNLDKSFDDFESTATESLEMISEPLPQELTLEQSQEDVLDNELLEALPLEEESISALSDDNEIDLSNLEVESAFQDDEEIAEIVEDQEDESLPDYLDEEADYDVSSPVLDETREDQKRQQEREQKKQKIDEAKKVKPPRTKKTAKSAKRLTPEEKQKKALQRQAHLKASREKAQKKKKLMLSLLIGSFVVLGVAGVLIWYKAQSGNRQKVEKAINFDTDKKLLGFYTQFEEAFSGWEQDPKNQQRALEAKTVYFDMRDYVMQWSDELEMQGKLTPKIEKHLGKRMQQYQEQYRQLKAFLNSTSSP